MMHDFDDIKTEVLNRLDMQQVASMCGVVMKKAGAGLWVSGEVGLIQYRWEAGL